MKLAQTLWQYWIDGTRNNDAAHKASPLDKAANERLHNQVTKPVAWRPGKYSIQHPTVPDTSLNLLLQGSQLVCSYDLQQHGSALGRADMCIACTIFQLANIANSHHTEIRTVDTSIIGILLCLYPQVFQSFVHSRKHLTLFTFTIICTYFILQCVYSEKLLCGFNMWLANHVFFMLQLRACWPINIAFLLRTCEASNTVEPVYMLEVCWFNFCISMTNVALAHFTLKGCQNQTCHRCIFREKVHEMYANTVVKV